MSYASLPQWAELYSIVARMAEPDDPTDANTQMQLGSQAKALIEALMRVESIPQTLQQATPAATPILAHKNCGGDVEITQLQDDVALYVWCPTCCDLVEAGELIGGPIGGVVRVDRTCTEEESDEAHADRERALSGLRDVEREGLSDVRREGTEREERETLLASCRAMTERIEYLEALTIENDRTHTDMKCVRHPNADHEVVCMECFQSSVIDVPASAPLPVSRPQGDEAADDLKERVHEATHEKDVLLLELKAAASTLADLRRQGEWQPIATLPADLHDTPLDFWIVPKTAEEAYVNTSGDPIFGTFPPYRFTGKFKTWSSLSKATHWRPLPDPPAQ